MNVLVNTRELVARAGWLIRRQETLIDGLERLGKDTQADLALYYAIYRSLLLMLEYRDRLEAGFVPVSSEVGHECVDEWLQMLAPPLASNYGPHGAH